MSQLSVDIRTLGGIVSDFFDGKASFAQAEQRLGVLGTTIGQQIKTDAGQVATLLGPQATAAIQTGLGDIKQALGGAITLVDEDLAPYFTGAAKAAESALDSVMVASLGAGGAALAPLVNGGIDSLAGGLKAAIDAQALAWKAKLAAQAAAPAPAAPPAAAG